VSLAYLAQTLRDVHGGFIWARSVALGELLKVTKDRLTQHDLFTGRLALQHDFLDQFFREIGASNRLIALCQLSIGLPRRVLKKVEVEDPPGALGWILSG